MSAANFLAIDIDGQTLRFEVHPAFVFDACTTLDAEVRLVGSLSCTLIPGLNARRYRFNTHGQARRELNPRRYTQSTMKSLAPAVVEER
jgi:hypothetical protein